jgi:methionyl-tRNA formyltransferase
MLKLGILCSGQLGFDTLSKIALTYRIEFILTDRNSDVIINFAKINKIPYFIGNPRNGKAYAFIKEIEVDVIISINYLFLIEEDIINHPLKLSFNIHGSLLPKYRGRTPHVWAIINGESQTGITAHLIDSGCDTGDIINQIVVPIEEEDTGAKILEKYSHLYFPLIKQVLDDISNNTLQLTKQINDQASYYGKRTPDDGLIDWNWDHKQIKNWVRAQAYPYPGAFTYYNNEKIIIDKVSVEKGFNSKGRVKNGEILQMKPNIIVKTEGACIRIDLIRTENCNFELGNIFKNEISK